jgi:hypothetical protein
MLAARRRWCGWRGRHWRRRDCRRAAATVEANTDITTICAAAVVGFAHATDVVDPRNTIITIANSDVMIAALDVRAGAKALLVLAVWDRPAPAAAAAGAVRLDHFVDGEALDAARAVEHARVRAQQCRNVRPLHACTRR